MITFLLTIAALGGGVGGLIVGRAWKGPARCKVAGVYERCNGTASKICMDGLCPSHCDDLHTCIKNHGLN